MGNSLIFPAPRCSYSNSTLVPFFQSIPVEESYYSSKAGDIKTFKRKIPSLYVKASNKSEYLIIYFHGNAEDLGIVCPQLLQYYEHFQIDILAPEYPGYGTYKGKANADKIIRDAQHTIDYATSAEGLNYKIENIILIGRSVGTGIAIDLASRYPLLRGVVLVSAFTSMRNVARNIAGSISKFVIPDIFQSVDIVGDVKVPILFVHGKRDEVIPFTHSIDLYEKSGSQIKRLELSESMGHNRGSLEKDIFKPMEKFLIGDLGISDLVPVKSKVLDLDQILRESTKESDLSLCSTFAGSNSSLLLERMTTSQSLSNKTPKAQPKKTVAKRVIGRTDADKPCAGPMFKSFI